MLARVLLWAAVLWCGCDRRRAEAQRALEEELQRWSARRVESLTKEDGWLSLAGLCWLEEGTHALGSDPSSHCRFPPRAPGKLGTVARKGEEVSLELAPRVAAKMSGAPVERAVLWPGRAEGSEGPRVEVGPVTFFVIRRGDRLALRLIDRESEARRSFPGIERFPAAPEWVVTARFEPTAEPQKLRIQNIVGLTEEMAVPGALVFSAGGRELRLLPVAEPGDDSLFIMFADLTTGKETYGAGRYLSAELPKDGKVKLDFNRAYNPPCAFTSFATCPLPPAQNRLPIRVEAGEKAFHRAGR
ncbi:MAG: DUF1684 domain-containing protein [Myxococcales bacterium]|nr:DUF1684 domain-containing protein [Myxococcales bacterium]